MRRSSESSHLVLTHLVEGARHVQICTSNFEFRPIYYEEGPNSDADSFKVAYVPTVSESYTIWYQGRRLKIARSVESIRGGWSTRETLTMRLVIRDA